MLWSSIFRGKPTEERLSVNDWAEMFSFGGNTYPIMGTGASGSKKESIDTDFVGYVQGAYKANGVVFACILAKQLIFSEARFQYQYLNNGRPGDLFGSKELAILEKPWPNGDTGELLSRALQDVDLAGNHYMLREGVGASSRLRRLRPDWVDIILNAPPDEALASDVVGYLYRPGGTQDPGLWELYPVDGSKGAVAHWAPNPDPEAQYKGMSWLTPVITEILADKAANKHKAAFFDNAATPALAVSFKETVTNEQFNKFMEQMRAKGGVDHAHETMFLAGGADVKVIGANLQQMDFRTSMGHGETRIAMAARIHPAIVGLAEGMHGSTLNEGNFKAAKNQFADGTLRPLWRSLANAYSVLVADFGPGVRLWYDDRDISFLRQDREELAQIRQLESQTISAYIQSGFTPESIIQAQLHGDIGLMKHSGLFSVQLQPPGTMLGGKVDPNAAPPDANKPAGKADSSKANAQPLKNASPDET